MSVAQHAYTFEQHMLATELAGISGVAQMTPISATFALTDAIVHEVKNRVTENDDLGALAQLFLVLSSGADLKTQRDGVRRIIISTLRYEADASKLVDEIKDKNIPELAIYNEMSFRWLLKAVSFEAMVALAASLSAPTVMLRILLSRISSERRGEGKTWRTFHTDYDFSVQHLVAELGKLIDYPLSAAALWSAGPFANGVVPGAQSGVAASASPAPTPDITDVVIKSSAPAASTVNVNTTSNTNMTTATMNPVAQALSSINPAIAPVLDSVLGQVSAGLNVAKIVAEVNAKAQAEAALAKMQSDSEATITALRKTIAAAASMPTTLAVTGNAMGIPSGKMRMVDVASVFPQLKGYDLQVPMFDWDHAHPDVPAVNDDYIFRKEMLLKALRCLARNENFWLQGHTGSGKTTFIEQIAARLGWPVARIAFDSNVDRSELVGRMQLTPDGKGGTESKWLAGILERATTGGYILLCDELDAGHPNALYTLQPVLEGKPLTLLEDGGRIVPRSPLARVVATGNTAGNGDASGLYPACRILSAATLDRFAEFIEVPYMTRQEEAKLISSSVPGMQKSMLDKLVKFAVEMRAAFVKNETPVSYSPRRSVAFARAVDDFFTMGVKDEKTALSLAFKSKVYDAANSEFRQRLTEIANNSLGGVDPSITL